MVHEKIQVLEGVHEKTIYKGDCLKKEACTAWIFKGDWLGKKEVVVFLRALRLHEEFSHNYTVVTTKIFPHKRINRCLTDIN